jgi:biopolymer transport protein ExbD
MNFSRGTSRDEPEINLIPLIDVLLVILIFLMVTTTYARFSELQINLPEAKGDSAQESPMQIEIGVDAGGHYSINGKLVEAGSAAALAGLLKQSAADTTAPVVVINADARASHQSVITVMDAARRAGLVRVTFVARSNP